MFRIIFSGLVLMVGFFLPASGQFLFFNELHYDDVGADTLEGFEIAAPAGTNLACFKVQLYNGSTGAPYSTIPLSGVVPNLCNGYGVVWFPVPSGLQNGSPDGLALIFDPGLPGCGAPGTLSVMEFISYEGSFVATSGDAVGMTSRDIHADESGTTPEMHSLQLRGSGSFPSAFSWYGPDTSSPGAINPGQTFNDTACGTSSPVASTYSFFNWEGGCITPGDTFSVTVCATDANGRIDLTYFGGGAIVTLSQTSGPGSLAGSLSQPVLGGCAQFTDLTLSAAGTIVLGAADVPPFGTGISGASSNVHVVTACDSCPYMTGAFIDACGPTEGNNEILFFNSGSYTVPANSLNWGVSYGTSTPAPTNYTRNIVSNQAFIDSLNVWAGCNIFLNPQDSGGIPPGSNFIILRFDPNYPYNFQNWCSRGPVYVLFTEDPDWNSTGNFKNCLDCGTTGSTPRYFDLDFTGLPNGDTCAFTYSYNPCADLLCQGNGDGLNFGYGGGGPTFSWNNCVPFSVLPLDWAGEISARKTGPDVQVQWGTLWEQGVREFEIYRKIEKEGVFELRGRLPASGNEVSGSQYVFVDQMVPQGKLYYRIRQIDLNGNTFWSDIAEVESGKKGNSVEIVQGINATELNASGNPVRIEIMNSAGQIILQESGENSLNLAPGSVAAGIYLYRVIYPAEVKTGRFIIH